jgi:hypothetical protein
LIGLHRQFVFASKPCFCLRELSLIAGAILTYVAVVVPPVSSGFWDHTSQATPVRLRQLANLKKDLVMAQLPKGIEAHHRLKRAT